MKFKKHKINIDNFTMVCGIGFAISSVVTFCLVAISALFIFNEYFSIYLIPVLAMIIQFISVFIGCYLAGIITKDKKAPVCFAVTGVYYLLLVATCVLLFNGLSGNVFAGLIGCAAGCGLAILLCTKEKTRIFKRRTAIRHR